GAAHTEMRHGLGVHDHIAVGALTTRWRDKAGAPLRDLVAIGVIEEGEGPADGERRADRADEDSDLLAAGRRPHQKSRLEVLRRVAAIGTRYGNHAGD